MEMGERVAKRVLELNPENVAGLCAALNHLCCCCQVGSPGKYSK